MNRSRRSTADANPFIVEARLDRAAHRPAVYPFTLPVVQAMADSGGLNLGTAVTFLVGHNGSGKSTLLEAIATAAGFNPEGGSTSFRFSTADSHSLLGQAIILRRSTRKPKDGYFLRAESFYNVVSEIDRLDSIAGSGPRLIDAYGGTSLHRRSHGESFVDLLAHRFRPNGLYLLDEPEAALSPQGAMAALARIHHLAEQGAQFIVATHSPILLAVPDARILEFDDIGRLVQVEYDEAMPVVLTREFLSDRQRLLDELLRE